MARDTDLYVKISSPRIFLVRMAVFLILCALLAALLYRQIWSAFLANPWLNGLILGALLIGILFSFRQVLRLFPEVDWVNGFRLADPGSRSRGRRCCSRRWRRSWATASAACRFRRRRCAASSSSIGTRLDESRDIARYLTGLLVFLGLLGTFWGLLETIGSIGKVIQSLEVGRDSERDLRRSEERPRRAARRHGHRLFVVAVRTRRLAGAWLPRSAGGPGAEPLLHRSRRLALDHGARDGRGRRARRRRGAGVSGQRADQRDRTAEEFDRGRGR